MYNPVLNILRVEENFQFGTFGIMLFHTEAFCVTLEPPDIENASNISSIPAQQYMCERVDSPKYGDTFQIMNVPDRDHVLFHPGNLVKHTKACVIVAQHFGKLGDKRAILNSGTTFDKFMYRLQGHNRFHLTIREVY